MGQVKQPNSIWPQIKPHITCTPVMGIAILIGKIAEFGKKL